MAEFDGWRVTALCRPKYSFGHNLRLQGYVENQKHIDPTRNHEVLLHLGDERESYQAIFGEAIKKYNARQKRKDRRITDYYQKILDDERSGSHKNPKANAERKPFYEFQFYIGNRNSHCPDEKAKKVLSLYIQKIMVKKFPNFVPTSITMHNDEFSFDRKGNRIESPLHFHVVGVFVAHALTAEELKEENEYRAKCKEAKKSELAEKGIKWDDKEWKKKDWRAGMIDRWGKSLEKGMGLQSSMSAACNEMGFFTEKGKGTAQQQFEEALRYDLMDFCESMGIKINRTKGYSHSHKEKEVYKAEQDNLALEAELNEAQELLEAKEFAFQNQKDDFDYKIEHLEEIEQELNNQKSDLEQREERLQQDEQNLKNRENQLSEEKKELAWKEKEIDSTRKYQVEKEAKLSRDEKYLDYRKEKLDEQAKRQNEREKRILQGEEPLLKKERELTETAKELSDRENAVLQKESNLEIRETEIQEREKITTEKSDSAVQKELLAKAELEEAQNARNESISANNEMQKIYEENQNQITQFNAENRSKIEEIAKWKEAAEQIKDSDSWINSAFIDYKNNLHKENALQTLFQKVKAGVAVAIAKVKQAYDKKLSELHKRLFGHKRFYHSGDTIVCEYSYGESDYADMLRDTPVSEIEKAISETKRKGKSTFAEAAALDKGFFFYERYFTKAKTLAQERQIELEREREREGYSR
ncbi:MAG: hypothetical protein IJ257_05700 [Treponema sp.]|nr:hypothetical protein [Treponema sp.]